MAADDTPAFGDIGLQKGLALIMDHERFYFASFTLVISIITLIEKEMMI
jgi:hypothetical protein